MPLKSLMALTALALLTLSGCATSGSTNTTYAQWTGPYPEPDVSAASPGGFRISY
ncbi:hypothetical protein ACI2KT_19205 [Ensifer adhaerens]|jgi:outer membrane lipoprotein-sorting protein|uniref:Lipoprotein n=1 Tax=Ensifer adhaerens TaxID=106592 RepID=A0A9Q8Y961_ENSAD|nr:MULTISPECIES: hypothetical protein [Ensifer]MBD9493544.1 hypothetical protein [Ensifer sp. ENS01]MBD9519334.1 hypothetical protein [Ensifer sp. ENS02]MBD9537938.1 hypothetical protein [Ensifer sp. ENS04]MBD9556017.1 hypothetical protein [Ensifer sp. ENS03]MBD9570374.1 hypothetical protein [Ensifer sp. ENS08]